MKLCFDTHKDQVDKSGLPYVFHPFHLAEQMEEEYTTVVALLHDVVEDSDMTLEDLSNMGYPSEVIDALGYLTHENDVPYMEYVNKIKENDIATKVKIADLRHNSDLSRLDKVTEKDLERVKKYREALEVLVDNMVTVSKKCRNKYILLTRYLMEEDIEFKCFKKDVMETLRFSEYVQDYGELFRITGVDDGNDLINGDPYTRNGTCIIGFMVWIIEQGEEFFNSLLRTGVIKEYLERLQDIDDGNRSCRVRNIIE